VTAVFELIGLGQTKLLAYHVVAHMVLGIGSQVVVLLLGENFLHRFVHFCRLNHSCRRDDFGKREFIALVSLVLLDQFGFDLLNVVLEAGEWRRRPLPCGEGRQILQLRLDVLDVAPERVDQGRDVGDVAAADAADGLLGHRIIVSYHRIVALARTCT